MLCGAPASKSLRTHRRGSDNAAQLHAGGTPRVPHRLEERRLDRLEDRGIRDRLGGWSGALHGCPGTVVLSDDRSSVTDAGHLSRAHPLCVMVAV